MDQTRFTENLSALEDDLGLPRGFWFKLLREEGWSLVMKAGALLEAAVVHVLSDQHPGLRPLFKTMNWPSRVQCLKGFGLLEERAYAFIDALVWLRNRYAHNIQHVNSSILDILSSSKEPRQKMRALALLGPGEPVLVGAKEVSIEELFQTQTPEVEIVMGLAMVLVLAYDHVRFSREMIPSIFKVLAKPPEPPKEEAQS